MIHTKINKKETTTNVWLYHCSSFIPGFLFPRKVANFQIELSILSLNNNGNIWNFGYSVSHHGFHYQDGRETKNLFSKHERENLRKSIYDVTNRLVMDLNPDIIARGPMTKEKTRLSRYQETTKIFIDNGYKNILQENGDHGLWWVHAKDEDTEIPDWSFLKNPPPPGYETC